MILAIRYEKICQGNGLGYVKVVVDMGFFKRIEDVPFGWEVQQVIEVEV